MAKKKTPTGQVSLPARDIKHLTTAVMTVRQDFTRCGGDPEQVFAALGLDAAEAIEAIGIIPTDDLDSDQAMVTGVLIGLRLADYAGLD